MQAEKFLFNTTHPVVRIMTIASLILSPTPYLLQGKFYKGDGYLFAPFDFKQILENPDEDMK
jgi:hypothetical protein